MVPESQGERQDDMTGTVQRELKGTMKPGQDLVIAGYAGREGGRRISIFREKELRSRFSRDYIELMQQSDETPIDGSCIPWRVYGATEWEEVSEGGIFTALWNLSGAYRVGFSVDLHRIPIRQETIEVCERYDVNPYRLLSSNCILAVSDHGWRLCERLAESGVKAAVIGRVNPGIKREVCYGRVRGFMERPREDEIRKIIQEVL